MARPAIITTPIPTLQEFGESIGLSKKRQRALAPIVIERRSQGDYIVKRFGFAGSNGIRPTQREAVERARELRPSGIILVERVRETSGVTAKWRKA